MFHDLVFRLFFFCVVIGEKPNKQTQTKHNKTIKQTKQNNQTNKQQHKHHNQNKQTQTNNTNKQHKTTQTTMTPHFLFIITLILCFTLSSSTPSTPSTPTTPSTPSSILSPNTQASCELCDLDLPGLIQYYGYPVEQHSLVPPDEYVCYFIRLKEPVHSTPIQHPNSTVVLNLYRIPGRGPPVLLQHGLLDAGCVVLW